MKSLIIKWKLWRWDVHNADVLALAERMQTTRLAQGRKSERLEMIIQKLRRERDLILKGDI